MVFEVANPFPFSRLKLCWGCSLEKGKPKTGVLWVSVTVGSLYHKVPHYILQKKQSLSLRCVSYGCSIKAEHAGGVSQVDAGLQSIVRFRAIAAATVAHRD